MTVRNKYQRKIKLQMNNTGLDVDTLFKIAEEYQLKGVETALKNDHHVAATLINQSIVVYTFLVDKHDDPKETSFYLSFEKLMHAYLKLIDLLVKYTTNWKLVKKITQKAILKVHELTENSFTDDQKEIWYILHGFYYYVIPMKMYGKSSNKDFHADDVKLAYKQFEQFLQSSSIATDWKVLFTICQISFYFKLEDASDLHLSEAFEYLDKNLQSFKEGNPDVFIYVQLCKACYYISKNEIAKMDMVLKENGGESIIEKVIDNQQLLMSFYLILLYRDLIAGVRSSTTISKIHKLLTSNKKNFVKTTKIFVIKSNRSVIQCESSLLEYSFLKDLLLFFQGISYLDKGSIDLQREMSEMFFKRIFKGKSSMKWQNSSLGDMITYYRKWQDEIIFGFEIDEDHPKDFKMEFAYAYMKFIQKETPTIKDIDDFLKKHESYLKMPKYEDMATNLKLQKHILSVFNDENEEENLRFISELNGNETFEDTKTAIKMIYDKNKYDLTGGTDQNTNILQQHDAFLKKLKTVSSKFKEDNVSEKSCFLVVIFSILRIDVEDNLNEKFTKYYDIIKGLLINDMKRIFPLKFWIHIINYTIEIGTRNNESVNKVEELKKLSSTLN